VGPGTTDLKFSHNSRRLVQVSPFSITVWDTMTGLRVTSFRTPELQDAVPSADGSELATLTKSGVLQAWNVRTGRPIGSEVKTRFEANESGLDLDPETHRVIAGDRSGIQVFDTFFESNDTLIRRACRKAGRPLTRPDWRRYLRGWPYRPLCTR
jgi:hypothetical protein